MKQQIRQIGETQSVCPVCLQTIEAVKSAEQDGIYLEKECPQHGRFRTLIWEGNEESYLSWDMENTAVETPVLAKRMTEECPKSCGLCEEHKRKGCCVLLEVTRRCNLNCPVCFASAGEKGSESSETAEADRCTSAAYGDGSGSVEEACGSCHEPTLEEIRQQYVYLMEHGGPFNIQLSGGEPTMRDDLTDIIRLGREIGFTFFQLNTNGLRLAKEPDYAVQLKEAGLSTVFLQFDGVTDDVYQALRGRPLLEQKMQAIDNCRKAGIGVCLVPVIAPGVNEEQIGSIIRFAMERMPFVRGVHFQPISYFGRCGQERPEKPITIPRILKDIEEQTNGKMKAADFAGGGAENPYCSFHAGYQIRPDGSTKLMAKKSGGCCCNTTSDDSRKFVEDRWKLNIQTSFTETVFSETSALDAFLQEIHQRTFTVSGMLFQDAYNLDLQRLKRCYILEMDPSFGMVPFCAYNLTDAEGKYLYRRI
ncbi:MAG: radical SAM protein [Eubacteriales bacterium]|nr:radical SAM protein [Eubacteriales bacterium]